VPVMLTAVDGQVTSAKFQSLPALQGDPWTFHTVRGQLGTGLKLAVQDWLKLQVCDTCKTTYYCSKKCQISHWPAHKLVCNSMLLHEQQKVGEENEQAELTTAIEASIEQAAELAAAVNAPLSEAILRSQAQASSSGPCSVLLLEFSRDPKSFHHALLTCAELQYSRDLLTESGFSPELPSQAKVFVPPELYEVTLEAVRLQGIQLKPRHVIVHSDLEELVIDAVRGCKGREKVRCKDRRLVPLNAAGETLQLDHPVVVCRTFLHVKMPSDLRSLPSAGPVTVSTGDAHGSINPRAA